MSRNFYEIRCESTKITKIRVVNTNLGVFGLDFHSNSPEPVNFFGAQSSLGGHNFRLGGHKQSFGGARPRNGPRGAGPGLTPYHGQPCISQLCTITKDIFLQKFSKTKKRDYQLVAVSSLSPNLKIDYCYWNL